MKSLSACGTLFQCKIFYSSDKWVPAQNLFLKSLKQLVKTLLNCSDTVNSNKSGRTASTIHSKLWKTLQVSFFWKSLIHFNLENYMFLDLTNGNRDTRLKASTRETEAAQHQYIKPPATIFYPEHRFDLVLMKEILSTACAENCTQCYGNWPTDWSMFVPGQGFLFLNFKQQGDLFAVDLNAICIEVCRSIKTGKTPERFFVAHFKMLNTSSTTWMINSPENENHLLKSFQSCITLKLSSWETNKSIIKMTHMNISI